MLYLYKDLYVEFMLFCMLVLNLASLLDILLARLPSVLACSSPSLLCGVALRRVSGPCCVAPAWCCPLFRCRWVLGLRLCCCSPELCSPAPSTRAPGCVCPRECLVSARLERTCGAWGPHTSAARGDAQLRSRVVAPGCVSSGGSTPRV